MLFLEGYFIINREKEKNGQLLLTGYSVLNPNIKIVIINPNGLKIDTFQAQHLKLRVRRLINRDGITIIVAEKDTKNG